MEKCRFHTSGYFSGAAGAKKTGPAQRGSQKEPFCGIGVKKMIKTLRKLFGLLDKQSKVKFPLILVMMLIETLFEAVSISLIVPLVSAMMDENIMTGNSLVSSVCAFFRIGDQRTFIIFCSGAIIAVFLVKNIFMFVECRVRYDFICRARHTVQKRIFSSILDRPYEFFLNAQSGEIIREVSDDCNRTFNLFGALMDVCANVFLAAGIAIVLLTIDPGMTAVVMLMMLVLSVILIKIVKPTLRKQGSLLVRYATRNYKNLIEAVQGIKTVKITRSQPYFNEEFCKNGEKVIEADQKNTVLNRVPHAVTEFVCVATVLLYILVRYLNGADINALIPTIGAFSLASLKLAPSVRIIVNAYYAVAFNEEALNKVAENYKKAGEAVPARISVTEKPKESIELSHVTYRYPGSDKKILDDASLTIPVGSSVGIMGVSGIGKTTTADVLLGLLRPREGSIAFDGREIEADADGYPIRIGYVPQTVFLLDDTIRKNIAFGVPEEEIRDDRIREVIKTALLEELIASLPNGIDTDIGENGVRLSGGQRQRIGIARALYHDPDLLIFDEATSSLDLETEAGVLQSIWALQGKKTMLIIAHRPQTVKGCDRIYRMENGKLIHDEQ